MMLTKVTQIVLMVMMLAAPITEASAARREKPKSTVLVRWQQVDVTDPEVRGAAANAVDHLERARNSTRVYRLQEVTSAKFRSSRGDNFELVLKIGQTDCFRHRNDSDKSCSTVKVERCVMAVRVWQNNSEVTNSTCENEDNVGGSGIKSRRMRTTDEEITDVDVNRKDVREAATFAVEELTRLSNGRYRVKLLRIIKATVQLLSGAMYRLTLDVSVKERGISRIKTTRCTLISWYQTYRDPAYSLDEHKCDSLIP